jgi:Spy/CpxP family protein refolding chaperone
MAMAVGAVILVFGATGCREDAVSPAQAAGPTLEQQDEDLLAVDAAPMPLVAHLAQKLDLTAGQRREIRGILRREHRALRESGLICQGPDKIHAWVRERHGRVADEIAGRLTPAQREAFAAMRARAEALAADGAGRGQVLARLLNLDEAQKSQAAALIDRKREALKGLRDEALAGRMSRPQMRERARTERQQFHAALKEILTPEQKVRLEELIQEWRSDRPRGGRGR